MRDGVNINSAQRIKRLVLPDEIKNLNPRTCFVKLCGNYPITKLKVNLQAHGKLLKFLYGLLGKSNQGTEKQGILEETANNSRDVKEKNKTELTANYNSTSSDSQEPIDNIQFNQIK
jgi:type IV secretory pathway TraG/TraD family ATPase VirD4